MILQPNDPASEAFERLRLEVALLRRGVEGLSGEEAVDYGPTLADLSDAVGEVKDMVAALGERPVLALQPEHAVALLQRVVDQRLAQPAAGLERERRSLGQAVEALRAAQAKAAEDTSWRRRLARLGSGVVVGAFLWGVLLGPVARALPAGWRAPERLAAATLALPMAAAGQRLIEAANPMISLKLGD